MNSKNIAILSPLLLLLTLSFVLSLSAQQNKKQLIRISPERKHDLDKLKNLDLDYATEGLKDQIDIIVDRRQLEAIKNLGFQYELLPAINKANLYDSEYHTYEEMLAELDSLQQVYPDITSLHQIGVSQQYRIPIWAIKISDNASIDEDEFTVLYDGVHHAREPIGLESCMVLINHLLSEYGSDPQITKIVDNIEIWIIPILNTEGYTYLVDNDLSSPWWRKNQRDNNENNQFDSDVDGVDLNRNYDYQFTSGGSPDFSSWTYRGPYPFSESEVAAKRDLALRERFLCSVTYHSYGEIIYYSRGTEGSTIPETPLIDQFANSVASRIPKLSEAGHYDTGGSTSSTNMSYPWMFVVAGAYEVLIETGTEFIPPGRIGLKVAFDNLKGAMYLLEKTIAGPGIRGHVKDAVTDSPLVADVKILQYFRSGLTPRKSEIKYGRFHRFASPGAYTLEASAPGYSPKTINNVVVNPTGWTDVEIPLEGGPTLAFETYLIDDDSIGQSLGNNNGIANINETIELQIGLKNIGQVNADSIVASLKSLHYYTKIIQNKQEFGAVDVDSTAMSIGKFVFSVDYRYPDGFELPFELEISDKNGLKWKDNFTVPIAAPNLTYQKVIIYDSLENNNGAFEPGESVNMEVFLANNGHMEATLIHTAISSPSGYITFVDQIDTASSIAGGEIGSVFFKLTLSESTPEPYITTFTLTLLSQEKYLASLSFRLTCLAGFFDDMEFGENGWWHEVRDNPLNDHDDWQWGKPIGYAGGQDPSSACSGSYCWGNDLGGTDWNGYYQHDVNIYLHSPIIDCSRYSDVGLKFMRWLNVRGDDVASILVNNQLFWKSPNNGLYDNQWIEHVIDISAIADGNPNVTISFGLTTSGSGWAGGWNIDDVMVKDQLMTEVPPSVGNNVPEDYYLFQNYPNPFNPSTTIRYKIAAGGKVKLIIFNLLGQEVYRLVDKQQSAGSYSILWDGKDFVDRDVASGIYLISFEVFNEEKGGMTYQQIGKMVLVR